MDPRPYNYEFRRPRINNPTYQSYNAYDSLYHMGRKEYLNPPLPRDEYPQTNNYYSRNYDNYYHAYAPQENASRGSRENSRRYEEIGVNTDQKSNRSSSNYSQRSKSSASSNNPNNQIAPTPLTHRTSVLSTYGSNSLERKDIDPPPKRESTNIVFAHNDTSEIFKKQQHPFDIINMYSRQNEPLRKYPKLTRQHLLYEQGIDLVKAE